MDNYSKIYVLLQEDLNERYVSRLLYFLTHHSTTDFCLIDITGICLKCIVNESDSMLFFILGESSVDSIHFPFTVTEKGVLCNISKAPLLDETELFSARYGLDAEGNRNFKTKDYNNMLKRLLFKLGINEAH